MSEIPKIARARLAQQAAGAGNHPDADQMTAFLERSLGAREREQVLEHLARCSACREVAALALSPEEAAGEAQPAPGFRWLEWQTLRWAAVAATFVIAVTLVFQTYREAPGLEPYYRETGQNQPLAATAPASAEKQTEPARANEAKAQEGAPASADEAQPRQDVAATKGKAPSSSTVAVLRDQETETVNGPSKLGSVSRAKTAPPAGVVAGVSGGRMDDYKKLDGGKAGAGAGAGALAKAAPSTPAPKMAAEPKSKPGPAAPAAQQQQVAGMMQQSPPSPAPTKEELQGQPVAAAESSAASESRAAADRVESVEVTGQNEVVNVEKDADKLARNARPAAKPAAKPTAKPTEGYEESRNLSLATASVTMRWIINSEGHVQRTIDNGQTWKEVALDKHIKFRAVAAAGSDVWAGGEGGALYHSSDSGNHWTRVPLPAELASATIVRVEFTDAEHGTLSTASGQTWATADSGATWAKK